MSKLIVFRFLMVLTAEVSVLAGAGLKAGDVEPVFWIMGPMTSLGVAIFMEDFSDD